MVMFQYRQEKQYFREQFTKERSFFLHSSYCLTMSLRENWDVLLTFGLQVLVFVPVCLYLRQDRLVTIVETFLSSTFS